MKFTLAFEGLIRSSGNRSKRQNKHDLRRAFHPQMKSVWRQEPYSEFLSIHEPSVTSKVADYSFVPLVTENRNMFAELNITLLSRGRKGVIGDIDGRLKTILDALRMPHNSDELPDRDEGPGRHEDPFFCLLEDDSLVNQLSIKTDRYRGRHDDDDSFVMIEVRVAARDFPGA